MALNRLANGRGSIRTVALIAALSTGVIMLSALVGHPLMGLRSATTIPALEVVEAAQVNGQIQVMVRNNDSNPVVGEAGYRLVDAMGSLLYESMPDDFSVLSPGESVTLSFDSPTNYPVNARIQGWAREHITYLDKAQPEGLSLRDQINQSLSIEQAALEVDGQGSTRLDVQFQLTNIEQKANQYRYSVGLTRVDVQNGTATPQGATRFSAFSEIGLAAAETKTISFGESGLALEPGSYSVSVWVQERDESGTFVQQAQATYGEEVIAS